jgi:acyl carrier protein
MKSAAQSPSQIKAIEDWLAAWFVARSKVGKKMAVREEVIHSNYFDAAWLTSMEVVEFVTEIEQNFAIQFSDRDLQDARFVTIAGLAELITELSAENAGRC